MRRIYLVDLGLLVAAGTLAIVLTSKSAASEPDDFQEGVAAIAVAETRLVVSATQDFIAEWFSNEEEDSESH